MNAILEYVERHPKPTYRLNELARALRLSRSELREALDQLVAEGALVEFRRHVYALPGTPPPGERIGLIRLHPAGFGFLLSPEGDLFIPKQGLRGAWQGDQVRARIHKDRRGRPFGTVEEILERGPRKLTGRLFFRRGIAWLHPDGPPLPPLRLHPEGLQGLREGARIAVEVINPPPPQAPFGQLDRLLEGEGPDLEAQAVILRHELKETFSPEALAEAEAIAQRPPDPGVREDFRELRVFTLDGADAKDFDDALHLALLPEGFEVGVHIADVSHYVPEGGPLDREARARGTSVYLPGHTLPMLPEVLSNGLCSLQPGEERLSVSILFTFDAKGRPLQHRFALGRIRSQARLTYEEVEAFFDGGELPEVQRFLAEDLRILLKLSEALKAAREEEGALDFHLPEVQVQLPELTLRRIAEPKARGLIEEFMLLANRTVAQHLVERGLPGLYRVHEAPSATQQEKLRRLLTPLGYELPDTSPKGFQAVLEQARGRPEAEAIAMLLLRSLKLARYAPQNLGHFGLAASHYLHFTSPIRRYPDLVVHRILKAWLRGKLKSKPWEELLPVLAEETSAKERAAEAAERELTRYYAALWAQAHQGERFSARVSGITPFALFATLENGVEGKVLLQAPTTYLEERLLLIIEGYGPVRLGDPLEIEIARGDPSTREIELLWNGAPRSPMKPSRTRRKVIGPPTHRQQPERPVKVTVQNVYFGEWPGPEREEPAPVLPERKRRHGRRSRRG